MELTGIKEIANIGAGTMGHAIALQFAMNGYNVKVYDRQQTGLQRGEELIRHDLKIQLILLLLVKMQIL